MAVESLGNVQERERKIVVFYRATEVLWLDVTLEVSTREGEIASHGAIVPRALDF